VYACRANGLPACVNIGVRPTFGSGRAELIEAYLIDFDGDLYGTQLRLSFLARLRGERRFETVEALIEEMHRDVAAARVICAGALG
jgi:riboflavin kinase/FMN adenylyltransferase